MRTLYFFIISGIVLILACGLPAFAQQSGGSDTAKVKLPAPTSPFGTLSVPTELLNTDKTPDFPFTPDARTRNFLLNGDLRKEYEKYGLNTPLPNFRVSFYDPALDIHPVFYTLLLVGAFFNNRIYAVPQEQEQRVMDMVYGNSWGVGRYGAPQIDLTKGLFGHPDLSISGYKVQVPEFSRTSNMIKEEPKNTKSTK